MYEYIDKMISGDVKTMKPVVEREGEEADVSSCEGSVLKIALEVSGRFRLSKMTEVPYCRVLDYIKIIVKMKRGLKGV